jgi:glycosyltransferase involved in cell wall biosynthesis
MPEIKKIVWVLNRLITVGGGEKLLLEGVEYYRSIGFDVYIITWEFSEKALFEGKYENKNIINLNESIKPRENIFQRAITRLGSIISFRRKLKELNPELIIVQGEYDVATTYIATLFTKLKYSFLIFGQIFQYPHDMGKYSLIFRKNLKIIIESQQGFKETIPLTPPKVGLMNYFSNEIISVIRYFAVRKAITRFTFSKSVQWETFLLFNVGTVRNQGAFKENIFEEKYDKEVVKHQLNIPLNNKILVSFSRLDKKKRIDIIIESLLYLPNDYFLVIVGTGECREELNELVIKHNLQNQVLFLGYIEEAVANSIKASADIFISVDIGDFDISPLEAMALGIKSIVSTEFDLDKNLSNFTNLKQSLASSPELAKVILEFEGLKKDTNYKEILKEYTWENYFKKILKESRIKW